MRIREVDFTSWPTRHKPITCIDAVRSGGGVAKDGPMKVRKASQRTATPPCLPTAGAVLGWIDKHIAHSGLGSRRKRLTAGNGALFAGTPATGTDLLVLSRTGSSRPRLQRSAHSGPPFNLTQIELAFPSPCALMALSIYVRFGSATCKGASSPCRISFRARRCLALFIA